MITVNVSASRSYDVIIGQGLLNDAGDYILPFCKNKFAAVITDDIVDGLYYNQLEKSLDKAGIKAVKYVIKNGEKSKNAENYINILNFLAENRLTRTDTVIALGGGVVGDLAGFAAATFLRGIGFIQIPTTLLAMVDSSVGGKTAIDLKSGKNLAGAFYQPNLVLCDYNALDTLSNEVFSDGCAEVIKYGVIGDSELFTHLLEKGKAFDRERVISDCVKMKRDIVNKDEFDTGLRQLLNLGHTFGHAIELCSKYKITHGRAVAIGMVIAARGAADCKICDENCVKSIEEINKKFGLPVSTDFGAEELYSVMLSDKKRKGDNITVVVPEKIGRCILKDSEIENLKAFLAKGLGS